LSEVEPFEGHLLTTGFPQDPGGFSVRFLRELQVPPASAKRYILYARFPELQSSDPPPELLLNSESGKTLRRTPIPITPLQNSDLLFVHLSNDVMRPNLPTLRGLGEGTYHHARISPEAMPELWTAYEAADAVVIAGWPDRGIDPVALQALRDYVLMGGSLVILAGMDHEALKGEQPSELLPVVVHKGGVLQQEGADRRWAITTDTSVAGKERNSYLVGLAEAKPGTEVLLEASGFPLIARRREGEGQIVFVAADLKAQTVDLERYMAGAWNAALPIRNLGAADLELTEAVKSFQTLDGSAGRPPNPVIVALACVLYAIVVGPIHFFVLVRRKRVQLAWLTLPAIVFLFTGVIYGTGRLLKSADSIYREVTVERFQEGQESGSSSTISSSFTADGLSVTVRPGHSGHAIADLARWHPNDPWRKATFDFNAAIALAPNTGSSNGPIIAYDVLEGADDAEPLRNLVVQSWPLDTYEFATMRSRGPAEMQGSIDADLKWKGAAIHGTVTNNSNRSFADAWLSIGQEMLPIGAFPAGATFQLTPADKLGAYGVARGSSRWSEWRSVLNRAEDGTGDSGERNTFALLRHELVPNPTGEFLPPRRGLQFIGMDAPTVRHEMTSLPATRESRHRLTCVDLRPRVLPGETIDIPGAYVPLRLLRHETPSGSGEFALAEEKSLTLKMRQSKGLFSAELPVTAPGATVDQVALLTTVREQSMQNLSFSIFRPGSGWLVDSANVPVRQPPALPSNGRLFFRLESSEITDAAERDARVNQPNFTFERDNTELDGLRLQYRITVPDKP
jgi:hypothetical protein